MKKCYRVLQYNDEGKYCSHVNIVTSRDIDQVMEEYYTKNDKYYEITQDDYIHDWFYSIDREL